MNFDRWYILNSNKIIVQPDLQVLIRQAMKIAYEGAMADAAEICKNYNGKISPAAIALKLLTDQD